MTDQRAVSRASLRTLRENLDRAGGATHILPLEDGAVALLLASGGRVLALFPGEDETNFLWTHPALADAQTAGSVFSNPHWINPGGDRTWLGPEHEWFVGDLASPGTTYRPPPALDPAAYVLSLENNSARMTTRAILHSHRTRRSTSIQIQKSISPAANPLRTEPDGPWSRLRFAGYQSEIALQIDGSTGTSSAEPPSALGLWQLLQLPPDGEMIIATHGRATPRVVVNEVSADDLRADAGALRYRMTDRTKTHKISVRALQLTGRVGYLRPHRDGLFDLVVRNFSLDPSGLYVDVPWNDLADRGYAFQACNVAESAVGHFSELEHHVPAIGPATGLTRSLDVSQVWAYRGDVEAIASAGRMLLGVSVR